MARWQRESGKTASCSVSLILDPTVDTCFCSCLERCLFVPGKVSKKHSTLYSTLRHFARALGVFTACWFSFVISLVSRLRVARRSAGLGYSPAFVRGVACP